MDGHTEETGKIIRCMGRENSHGQMAGSMWGSMLMIKSKAMECLIGRLKFIIRPDGRRYEGSWSNGKQHGQGVYYNAQGRRKEGEWQDGKRVRWINEDPSA